ncbi:MAG: CHAT domain-containing protein [Coleofasciculaceae cyanobacterium]
MRLQKIGLITFITVLATLVNVDLGVSVLGQFIQNPKSKIQNSQVLAQTPDARKAEADKLLDQGVELLNTSQFEAALQSWQEALIIYREIKDRRGEGASLSNLGIAYRNLGDYTKAIEYHQQSLAIAREIQDRKGEGQSLGSLGNAYHFLGDYAKAIEYHQQSLAIAKSIKNRLGEAASLGNLGNAYRNLGDYAKAIEYHQQSLAIAREIQDRKGEGQSLGNLGNAYNALGDYAKAIEYYQQSLAIAKSIKNRLGEEQSLGSLGAAYYSLGDYAKAIEYHQQQLAIAKSIKDRLGEGQSLGSLGVAYNALGDYAKAIEYQQQSLAIKREIQDRKGEGQSLGDLGNAYNALGDYAKAIEYHQQRLAIAQSIKDRLGEGQSLGDLGNAYNDIGDYAKAIEYHQQHLAIAKSIKDRLGEGNALGNLGLAYYYLGNYAKAIEYHQQSLTISREIGNKDGEGNALNNLGLSLQKSGNLTQAEKILRFGIEAREALRERLGNNDAYKVSIFEQQARTYRLLQQVLIAQDKPNAALEIAERGRARAFVELLARRNATTNDFAKPSIAPPTIELLQQIAKQQDATLVEYSIIYDGFKIESKEEWKESELYIWVIKPTGEITFRRSDLKPLWQQQNTSLDKLVTISRESIGVRSRGLGAVAKVDEATQTNRLQQLHQILIQPIANLLPTNPEARVIFMPQSSLFLVPFPALKDEQGKYLIEKHTILTAPSIQVLELTRKQRQQVQGKDALVVGNPTMPSVPPYPGEKPQQLAPLPGAEAEAKAIASLLNTQPLIGNQATESAVKQRLPKARIIHLATHGLLDDIRGIGSAIALTPDSSTPPTPLGKGGGGENNGLLTAEEILNLKLNAELVVLSACDTGRGRITGDGVVGLSRSLISAGVSSVIVSLWSVPDAPTASLMTEFYTNIQQRKLDKAKALRQAMLTTMKTHPNPRNWAAFTLIGEAE